MKNWLLIIPCLLITSCYRVEYAERVVNSSRFAIQSLKIEYADGRESSFINIPSSGEYIKHFISGNIGHEIQIQIVLDNGVEISETVDLGSSANNLTGYFELTFEIGEEFTVEAYLLER